MQVKGDLLKSDCTVIAHQANCFSTMGAGIAKQITNIYPHAKRADQCFPHTPEERLGKCSIAYIPEKPIIVFNLYGQYGYGRNGVFTNYDALTSAVEEMFSNLSTLHSRPMFSSFPPIKVGMPYGMGAGLAGGDFERIHSIVGSISQRYNIPVTWYKL
jgi:O-acetyl-ADP-ribose deacetylase (regulator of RNase III)